MKSISILLDIIGWLLFCHLGYFTFEAVAWDGFTSKERVVIVLNLVVINIYILLSLLIR